MTLRCLADCQKLAVSFELTRRQQRLHPSTSLPPRLDPTGVAEFLDASGALMEFPKTIAEVQQKYDMHHYSAVVDADAAVIAEGCAAVSLP